jgi:N-acetylglutamate synthase-like GNAT family acetyltransferase
MKIITYQPQYAKYFELLNKEWLQKYFYVEPVDEYVLTHPKEAILDKGGRILFAEHEGDIIGTIAIKWLDKRNIELTKMGVTEASRGLGAGKLLFEAGINTAREMGAEKIILYSNRKLETAVSMYFKFGFVEIPLEAGIYERADIKLELVLKQTADS